MNPGTNSHFTARIIVASKLIMACVLFLFFNIFESWVPFLRFSVVPSVFIRTHDYIRDHKFIFIVFILVMILFEYIVYLFVPKRTWVYSVISAFLLIAFVAYVLTFGYAFSPAA